MRGDVPLNQRLDWYKTRLETYFKTSALSKPILYLISYLPVEVYFWKLINVGALFSLFRRSSSRQS